MIASGASQDQIKEVNFGAREKSEEWKKRHQPDVEMDDIKAFFFFFFPVYFYSTEHVHGLCRI